VLAADLELKLYRYISAEKIMNGDLDNREFDEGQNHSDRTSSAGAHLRRRIAVKYSGATNVFS